MTDLIWIAFPGEIYCAINLKWLWLFGLEQQWDKSAAELDGSMPTATPNEMKHICGSDRRKYQGTSPSQSNSFHAWCQQSLQAPTGNTPRSLLSFYSELKEFWSQSEIQDGQMLC